MFRTVTMCTQLRTLRTGSYAPDKMIVVPRPVVNDVTATSLCQSYSAVDNYISFLIQQKLDFKEHV